MSLKRKIYSKFLEWKNDPNRMPLVVKGLRQCGKTYSVLDFARKNYTHVVYLNFEAYPQLGQAFEGTLAVDQIMMMVSAQLGKTLTLVPGKTVIVVDEIQKCPQARTALKFFKMDGRYDVIATGSLLGVNGYGDDASSIPVGYETTLTMRPLDFEEFLWANGIPEAAVGMLKNALVSETPVPEPLHGRMHELLLQYAAIGGMPAVVDAFIATHNMSLVLQKQRDLLNSYRGDMTKYAQGSDKTRIKECFDSIPRQLAKENKKFKYSEVKKGGRASEYLGTLQWLEDAGLIHRCRNVTTTELSLEFFSMEDCFKVYLADTGLFIGMLERGTAADILTGNLTGSKGAIFENLAADILTKMGRKIYYFQKTSGLEVDFLIRYKGKCVPLEVKATNGNVKSTKTILKHPEKYHVESAIKVGRYNVGRNGNILTMPFYMLFLLTDY